MTPKEQRMLFSAGFKGIIKQLEEMSAEKGAAEMQSVLCPYREECKRCTNVFTITPRFSPYEVHCKTKGLTKRHSTTPES
jgi:hypothetical protein